VVCVCKEVASLAGHAEAVFSVAFSPDGQLIVSGSGDRLVKVWSVSARKEVASLAGHTNEVWSVAFSPNGQHIVSGSSDFGEGVFVNGTLLSYYISHYFLIPQIL
jgi:WD40 repeat protein